MKINELVQISTELVEQEITVPAEYDDEGNILSKEHTETVTVERPVMGVVYRDMTPEEEAEMQTDAEPTVTERTTEERLDDLEAAVDILLTGVVE